jgi:GST-like protein
MINLYSATTINGRRAAIALAEAGLEHQVHFLDLQKGEQRSPEFHKLNPSGVIPVLVDDDEGRSSPITVTQSSAILLYCAEKSRSLIPSDPIRRRKAFEWFAQALTDVGPASSMFFQLSLMLEQSTANLNYVTSIFLKHCMNVERRLEDREFLADEFSIADIALYPIIAARTVVVHAADDLVYLKAWEARIAARSKTARAMLSHT